MLAVVYLALCFIVGIGAQNYRGRQGTPWFLLSFVITPLIGGLLLLASKDKRVVAFPVALGKTCPKCAEDVKLDAKVCRYCRHEFI